MATRLVLAPVTVFSRLSLEGVVNDPHSWGGHGKITDAVSIKVAAGERLAKSWACRVQNHKLFIALVCPGLGVSLALASTMRTWAKPGTLNTGGILTMRITLTHENECCASFRLRGIARNT